MADNEPLICANPVHYSARTQYRELRGTYHTHRTLEEIRKCRKSEEGISSIEEEKFEEDSTRGPLDELELLI